MLDPSCYSLLFQRAAKMPSIPVNSNQPGTKMLWIGGEKLAECKINVLSIKPLIGLSTLLRIFPWHWQNASPSVINAPADPP